MLLEEELHVVVVLHRVLGVETRTVPIERLAIVVAEAVDDGPVDTDVSREDTPRENLT